MLTLNLAPIFKIRGIEKPFTYLVQNGFTNHAAHLLINGKNRVFRLDHIEQLCALLICEPNDLLTYTPSKNQKLPANHPLTKLKHQDADTLKDTLAKMPLNEIKNITNTIINSNK